MQIFIESAYAVDLSQLSSVVPDNTPRMSAASLARLRR